MNRDHVMVTPELAQILKSQKDLYKATDLKAIADQIIIYHDVLDPIEDNDMLMATVRQGVDAFLTEGEKEGKELISCKRGCSNCCHVNINAYPEEAKAIVEYCNENGIEVNTEHLKEQLKYDPASVSRSDYSACVFLKNNECSVYPVRPINCRKYLVGSPPERCHTKNFPPPNNDVQILLNRDIELVLSAMPLRIEQTKDRLPALLLKLLDS